jgi:hypothetical protein
MDKDKFIQRRVHGAANARGRSLGELWRIRANQSLPERIAKVGFARTISLMLPSSIEVDDQSFAFYTSGGEQLIYASSNQMTKIIFDSLSFDSQLAASNTASYQSLYDTAQAHLGSRLVETDFDLRRFRGGIFATVALQPRLEPIKWFKSVPDLVMHRSDESYIAELEGLHEGITSLEQNGGLQIDLNGPNNILLAEDGENPSLRVVDTLPLSHEKQMLDEAMSKRGQLNRSWADLMQHAIVQARAQRSLSAPPVLR